MVDPIITPAILVGHCVAGLIGGPAGAIANNALSGGARVVVGMLRQGKRIQNDHLLRAAHKAYVAAMRDMADAIAEESVGDDERCGAKALARLVKEERFAAFRSNGEQFPADEANAAIDRMFGRVGTADDQRPWGRAAVDDLYTWNVTLTPDQARLFEEGGEGAESWAVRYRAQFAEALIADPAARTIFTAEQLAEVSEQGIELIDIAGRIEQKVDQGFAANAAQGAEILEVLRQLKEQQGPGAQASFDLLQALAAGYGEVTDEQDVERLKVYLHEKVDQWRDYRNRIEALEAESNRDRVLLTQARAATDRGDFAVADALVQESIERLDEQIVPLLIAKADRLSIRADNARLAGEYAQALKWLDQAAEVLPSDADEKHFDQRFKAALLLQEWGRRTADLTLLSEAIARLRKVLCSEASGDVERTATVQLSLGRSLSMLGDRQKDVAALQEALKMYRAALEVCTADRYPEIWATTQSDMGIALATISELGGGLNSLEAGVAAFRAALESGTLSNQSLTWAGTQANLGQALLKLVERGNMSLLPAAVDAFRAALQVSTRERSPMDWAGVLIGLGSALRVQGEQEEDTASLIAAVDAHRATLEVYSEDKPFYWAEAQNHLGNALTTLGRHLKDSAYFIQATAAYQASLTVYAKEGLDFDRAMIQHNLGMAFLSLGELDEGVESLEAAVAAFTRAIEVFDAAGLEYYRARPAQNLARAVALLRQRRR